MRSLPCISRTTSRRSALLFATPKLPQVACFDTAFHRTHGAVADHYAIPAAYYREGVRRYGFPRPFLRVYRGACARLRLTLRRVA